MRCDVCEHTYTTQINIDKLKDIHISIDIHMKFHRNLKTSVKNWLKVEKFSTFLVENLDPMHTVCKYAFNTVYNIDIHTLLDTTNIVKIGNTAIFRSGVKTEVNSSYFLLLIYNSNLSDHDRQSSVKIYNRSIFFTFLFFLEIYLTVEKVMRWKLHLWWPYFL
jgi:hypothetical protein